MSLEGAHVYVRMRRVSGTLSKYQLLQSSSLSSLFQEITLISSQNNSEILNHFCTQMFVSTKDWLKKAPWSRLVVGRQSDDLIILKYLNFLKYTGMTFER